MSSSFSFRTTPGREEYRERFQSQLEAWFSLSKPSATDLEFSFESSAVFSSNIEGNTVDLNSYMNQKQIKTKFKPHKEVEEINDLLEAYKFARTHPLNEANFLNAHKLLSRSFLIKSKRGKYRDDRMGVFSTKGLIYVAVEPENLVPEMERFWAELSEFTGKQPDITDFFYFSSLAHLRLAQLHPFFDGNGRIARLVEKWLLAAGIGESAWGIQSERFYKENRDMYYRNIDLGVNYYELDFSKITGFLEMLPNSLQFSHEK